MLRPDRSEIRIRIQRNTGAEITCMCYMQMENNDGNEITRLLCSLLS